ncbi:hypothetical protein DPMN_169932 [Dreissena polymorpha]|uniref:Uncharacterized protein n=1 Tax=Dreissena polymorpha TaxID=45954 RepID=A0A9D4DXN9_DREPO|nr:hypothetical protein DPMN_169932 [Dreissena polymorpha]
MNNTKQNRLLWLSNALLKDMNRHQRTVETMTALAQVCSDEALRVANNGRKSSLHSMFIHAGVFGMFWLYRWHTKECILDRAAEIE